MASMGLGSFMDGLAGGMVVRSNMDERDRRKANDERDYEDKLADRQRRISREDEERGVTLEDRKRRIALEDESRGFVGEQRARVRQQWSQEDALKQAQADAVNGARADREAAVTGSMDPIEAQGPTLDGKALPAWKVGGSTFTDEKQARAAGGQKVGSVLDFINGPNADRVVEEAVKSGNLDVANNYKKWLTDERVQKGAGYFANAVGDYSSGNYDSFVSNVEKAYNTTGYFDDGHTVRVTKRNRDDHGKIVDVDLEFTNRKTGQSSTQPNVSMNDVWRMSATFLPPDKVMEYGLAQVREGDKTRAEVGKEQRALQNDLTKEQFKSDLKRQEASGSNPYATGGFNEGQGKAASFADRMAEADAVIRGAEGINSGVTGAIGGVVANNMSSGAGNFLIGAPRQKFNQAQRSFVNAILRRESGAAISDSEFASARQQYFPQPGDSKEVLAQKRQNRSTAIGGMMREAGPSYRPPQGWGDPSKPPQAGGTQTRGEASRSGQATPAYGEDQSRAALDQARSAIAKGADPAAVAQRLQKMGIDPRGLQ